MKTIKKKIKMMKDEIRKKEIINAICKDETITMAKIDLLLSACELFVNKCKYKESQICNNEAIQLLNKILFKARQNKDFLKIKLAE